MDKTFQISLTRTEIISAAGGALALLVATWNLGAYVHGVLANANDLSQRVATLEQATSEVQSECACVQPIAHVVSPMDPVRFPAGAIAASPESTICDPDAGVCNENSLAWVPDEAVVRACFTQP